MKLSYAISDGEGSLIKYGSGLARIIQAGIDAWMRSNPSHSLIIGPYDGTGE